MLENFWISIVKIVFPGLIFRRGKFMMQRALMKYLKPFRDTQCSCANLQPVLHPLALRLVGYSRGPNKRTGPNKHTGWKNCQKQ